MSPSINPTHFSNVPHRDSAFQRQLSAVQPTLHPQHLGSFEHHTSQSSLAFKASSMFSSVGGELGGEGLGIVLRGENAFKSTLSSSVLEWQYRPFGIRANPELELKT